jgi:hypothetical protein
VHTCIKVKIILFFFEKQGKDNSGEEEKTQCKWEELLGEESSLVSE